MKTLTRIDQDNDVWGRVFSRDGNSVAVVEYSYEPEGDDTLVFVDLFCLDRSVASKWRDLAYIERVPAPLQGKKGHLMQVVTAFFQKMAEIGIHNFHCSSSSERRARVYAKMLSRLGFKVEIDSQTEIWFGHL